MTTFHRPQLHNERQFLDFLCPYLLDQEQITAGQTRDPQSHLNTHNWVCVTTMADFIRWSKSSQTVSICVITRRESMRDLAYWDLSTFILFDSNSVCLFLYSCVDCHSFSLKLVNTDVLYFIIRLSDELCILFSVLHLSQQKMWKK